MNNIKDLPFITVGKYMDEEIIGIMGNRDDEFTSIYILSNNMNYEEQIVFLDYGEEWWWETNRMIPINIILRNKWSPFKKYVRSFPSNDFDIISGPIISIDNLINTKIKRRKINLLKK